MISNGDLLHFYYFAHSALSKAHCNLTVFPQLEVFPPVTIYKEHTRMLSNAIRSYICFSHIKVPSQCCPEKQIQRSACCCTCASISLLFIQLSQDLDSQFKVREFLTTASPLQLHLLHVNLTGRHPDGNWVNDGRVLWKRQTQRGSNRQEEDRYNFFFFAAGPVRSKVQHENLCGNLLADMLTEHLIKHV